MLHFHSVNLIRDSLPKEGVENHSLVTALCWKKVKEIKFCFPSLPVQLGLMEGKKCKLHQLEVESNFQLNSISCFPPSSVCLSNHYRSQKLSHFKCVIKFDSRSERRAPMSKSTRFEVCVWMANQSQILNIAPERNGERNFAYEKGFETLS